MDTPFKTLVQHQHSIEKWFQQGDGPFYVNVKILKHYKVRVCDLSLRNYIKTEEHKTFNAALKNVGIFDAS